MSKAGAGGGAGGGPAAEDANAAAQAGADKAKKDQGKSGKKGESKSQKDAKKECRPKKVSKNRYDQLRRKTPNDDVRMGFAGETKCWACGMTSPSPLQPDHIVPMKQITQMKGFS